GKVALEAGLVVAVLACVVVLIHEVPRAVWYIAPSIIYSAEQTHPCVNAGEVSEELYLYPKFVTRSSASR
ncbi:MAG: hypothetical protein ACREYC_13255, partial [Gammaproteobacteria bacterium]